MIILSDFAQGTPEWTAARIGNPGASQFDAIVTSTGKPSAQREKLIYQMAGEILTGTKEETFQSAAMTRGIEMEAEARDLFSIILGVEIQQCAMVYPDERRLYHCSPDGIMPDQFCGLEIKCPSLPVAVKYLDGGVLPTEYKIQVQGSMMVTGYPAWYFMSYYPGLKPFILKVERDEKLIATLRVALESFCEDVQKLVKRLS